METPTASICPHLGLKDDPQTFMDYPSTGNCCFNCQSPAVPLMMHQETYCLSEAYSLCLVYSQDAKQPMPRHLRAEQTSQTFSWLKLLVVLVSVIALILIGWQLSQLFVSGAAPVPATATSLPSATALPSETPTPVPPTETPQPSATATPAPTATPTQQHKLETLITAGDDVFLIHLTLEGEIIETLVQSYDTTIEVIRSINYNLASAIWANTPIVIAPGRKEVDPAIPTFRAYQVTAAEIDIVDLAALLEVDAELLKKYNNCPQGCILKLNDWIIVPRGQ